MTNLTRLRLILVDLSGLMKKKTFETIFFSLRNLNISYKARDAQNVCAVTKGGTVLKIVWCASSIIPTEWSFKWRLDEIDPSSLIVWVGELNYHSVEAGDQYVCVIILCKKQTNKTKQSKEQHFPVAQFESKFFSLWMKS